MQDVNSENISPFVRDFQEAFVDLGIGECSLEQVSETINNGPNKIITAFNKFLNNQLDGDNVTSPKLRSLHINRHYSKIFRLKKAYNSLIEVYNQNSSEN